MTNRTVFVVEGFTEKLALQKICVGKNPIIKVLQLNGNKFTIQAIAKRIAPQLKLFMNKTGHDFVILIDREDRKEESSAIREALRTELNKQGVNYDLHIGVADRMLENWMLEDWECFSKHTGITINKPRASFEGLNGKAEIKRLFNRYSERHDGAEILTNSNAAKIALSSNSFNNFKNSSILKKYKWFK